MERIGFKEKTKTLQFGVRNGGMLLSFPKKKKERIKESITCFRVSMKENRGNNFETLSAVSAHPTHSFSLNGGETG